MGKPHSQDGERVPGISGALLGPPGCGAGGDSPGGGGGDAPLPGSIGSSALLQVEVLDLDEDEDDLNVFIKDASLMDTNSFSPLMPTSPLSMINQVKFEDEPDLKDLFITVDEPESHVTTIETFITYRIITKTPRGEFDSSEFEVRRRYQDFLWSKEKLGRKKFIVKGTVGRFNDDVIETRRKGLPRVLNPTAGHRTLTFNEDLKIFLTQQGPGLLSRMGQIECRPKEFMEMNNFIEIFSQKINLIDKISQRIYKEERDYFNEMKEYEDLADTLKSVASCIDKRCKASEKCMSGLSEALLPVVHKYVLYSEMLMAELDSRVEALTSKRQILILECANNTLKTDRERSFTNMAKENILRYERCLATWESFLTSQTDLHLEEASEDKL
ncbi:hypothetical protein FD755_008178 [Muntiacus reevesi]|uniref:PX domain-containing protein n=1 Tax=Muntiacus reevesi TaxID=9886 RepID=A0A5J5MJJ8_MUNRE|nr:hypothetical protein FD755_008178 [Muntiacus reevesi]